MTQFESRKEDLESSGAQLVFIAAEKRDGVWKPATFLAKHPIAGVFLLDEDRTVTRAYGVHHALGKDAIDIAHPATFLIGRDKIIRFIYRGDNQHDRVPFDDVLKAAQEI